MKFSIFLAAVAALMASCASAPLVGTLSPQTAQREAHRDIQSGHIKIYLAGTRGIYAVGVEDRDKALVAKLPRSQSLPSGCTDPQALAGIDYARAYNRKIVRHLRSHPNI